MSPVLGFPAVKGLLQARVNTLPGPLRILDAGCGRAWPLEVSQPHELTGLDLDPAALAARKDLHAAVVGDLRTAEFPAHSFDVVYCAFVLEYLNGGAERVLRRFLRWLAPGGTLILQVPDRDSAYAFLTRITPVWLHLAGADRHYPIHHDRVISQRGLREFCRRHGLPAPELYRMCTGENNRAARLAARLTGVLSRGRYGWEHDSLLAVLQTARPTVSAIRTAKAEPTRPAAVPTDVEPRVA